MERAVVQSKVWAQPYWNGGKQHISWDFWTDHPLPAFDTGKAILIGGAMTTFTYRPKYDVLLPLTRPHQSEPLPEVEYAGHRVTRLVASNAPASAIRQELTALAQGRDVLLSFKGMIYGFADGSCSARSRIFGKHFPPPKNVPDVVIWAKCGQDQRQRAPHLQVEHCRDCVDNKRTLANGTKVTCTDGFPDLPYHDGLRRSKFALTPAGCGPLSFRLGEAIGFGSIPVLAGNGTFIPIAGETALGSLWQRCVIHVTEEETATLVARLRGVSEQEYFERLAACVQIAALKIYELDVLVKQSMCIIASRISEALGSSKNWNDPGLQSICKSVGIPI